MTDLTPFAFDGHQLRACPVGDTAEFVAADLAAILNYATAKDMLRGLDEDEKGRQMVPTPGGDQEMLTVTEAGLYQLVLRRQAGYLNDATARDQVKRFQRWVTHVVLPSIRKTGGYGTQPQQFQVPQTLPEALRLAADEAERRMLAEAKVAELAPKAEYVDRFVADEDLRVLRNVAKSVDVAEGILRNALIMHGWIYAEHSTRWSEKQQAKVDVYRYSPMADKRHYFRPVPNHEAPRFKGEGMHTLKITPAGAVAIERAARRWGLVPAETEGKAA